MNDLTDNLFPKDSPYALNKDKVPFFDFDAQNESGIISTAQIRNASIGSAQIGSAAIGSANVGTLSFSQLYGGTATLGGTTNGNGYLQVLTGAGGTAVTLDNTGITVNNGSITINNSDGSAVIDSKGVNSVNTFANGVYSSGSTFQTTSDSFADVTGATLTFVTQREANVLIGCNMFGGNNASSDVVQAGGLIRLMVDGTTHGGIAYINSMVTGAGKYFSSGVVTSVVGVGAGTHTLQLQQTRDFGAGTAFIEEPRMYYVVLGK